MKTTKHWIVGVAMFLLVCESAAAQWPDRGSTTQPAEVKFASGPIDGWIPADNLSKLLGRPYQPGKNRYVTFLRVRTDIGFDLDAAFPAMAKQVPTTRPFTEGIADMLRSPENVVSIRRMNSSSPGFFEARLYQVILAAPTVEQLKQLTRAFIETCNAAWPELRPKVLKAELARTEDRSKKLQADRKEKEAQSAENDEVLKSTGQISNEIREQLRGKLLLLEVDVAGAKARLEAIDEHLSRMKDPNDAIGRRRLDDIKATTHIDLAGLLASRRQLAMTLNASDRLNRLFGEIERLRGALDHEKDVAKDLNDLLSAPALPLRILGDVGIGSIKLPEKTSTSPQPEKN